MVNSTHIRCMRIVDVLRGLGADWAVLTSAGAVAYTTGWSEPLEKADPFSAGPSVALVGADSTLGLLTSNAAAPRPGVDAFTHYDAYGPDHRAPGLQRYV